MRYSKWILLTSIELFSFSPFFLPLSTEGCHSKQHTLSHFDSFLSLSLHIGTYWR